MDLVSLGTSKEIYQAVLDLFDSIEIGEIVVLQHLKDSRSMFLSIKRDDDAEDEWLDNKYVRELKVFKRMS